MPGWPDIPFNRARGLTSAHPSILQWQWPMGSEKTGTWWMKGDTSCTVLATVYGRSKVLYEKFPQHHRVHWVRKY
jgi:hypothetical protein